MNIKPEQIPDEVVEAAFDAMRLAEAGQFGDIKTPNNGARHECMRHALAAALPVLLGEPVGFLREDSAIALRSGECAAVTLGRNTNGRIIPVYTFPTQDTPNADQ